MVPGEGPRRPARDGRRVERRGGQAGPTPEKTGEARQNAESMAAKTSVVHNNELLKPPPS